MDIYIYMCVCVCVAENFIKKMIHFLNSLTQGIVLNDDSHNKAYKIHVFSRKVIVDMRYYYFHKRCQVYLNMVDLHT